MNTVDPEKSPVRISVPHQQFSSRLHIACRHVKNHPFTGNGNDVFLRDLGRRIKKPEPVTTGRVGGVDDVGPIAALGV